MNHPVLLEPTDARTDADAVRSWYEESYRIAGFSAQRKYPNEELLRFFGRTFFASVPRQHRQKISVLELGCGSCANLWMVAYEGFSAHGVDLSQESIHLGDEMLTQWGVTADLQVASMLDLPFPEATFDVVYDVFSMNCLPHPGFCKAMVEAARVLKPGGFFFTYTPSKNSSPFIDPGPSQYLDSSTLDGIRRPNAPFTGNHYPFHFVAPEELQSLMQDSGFEVTQLETTSRSYSGGREWFEWIVATGRKRDPQ